MDNEADTFKLLQTGTRNGRKRNAIHDTSEHPKKTVKTVCLSSKNVSNPPSEIVFNILENVEDKFTTKSLLDTNQPSTSIINLVSSEDENENIKIEYVEPKQEYQPSEFHSKNEYFEEIENQSKVKVEEIEANLFDSSKYKQEDTSEDKKKQETQQDFEIKKSPMLKEGTYSIVFVHIEVFRSNKSSSTKLTQIGCITWNSDSKQFFRAIKPRGLEKYVDTYKLGGDLLKALHMTKENDGIFQFRSQFEIIEEGRKIVCVDEGKALKDLLMFLQNFQNCILVGIDEDSISILVKKLKDLNRDKFKLLVKGFTHWKRVLKYLNVPGYRNMDLEEFYSEMVKKDLQGFISATDIARVLLTSVKKVISKHMTVKPMQTPVQEFYKVCKRIECLDRPKKVKYDRNASIENVEVYSSFRPSVLITISAQKLEQVALNSDSDGETDKDGGKSFSTGGALNVATRGSIIAGSAESNSGTRSSLSTNKETHHPTTSGVKLQDIRRQQNDQKISSGQQRYQETSGTYGLNSNGRLMRFDEYWESINEIKNGPLLNHFPGYSQRSLSPKPTPLPSMSPKFSPEPSPPPTPTYLSPPQSFSSFYLDAPLAPAQVADQQLKCWTISDHNNRFVICPICNARVKYINMRKHFNKVHKGEKLSLPLTTSQKSYFV